MDPNKYHQLTSGVIEVYNSIEEQILINIANRLRLHNSLLVAGDIQSWQLQQLNQLGGLTQQNIVTIAKYAKMSVDEVAKMLQEAGYAAVKQDEPDITAAVQAGLLIAPPAIEESPALDQILIAYEQRAKNTFNLIRGTMLQQAEQAYTDILNQTTAKVLAGTITPQQALREACQKWAEDGIPALINKRGHRISTEAYVSLVTRSMSNNIANEMQDARMEECGVDLIEVSSHLGARPKCAPYQGRIFSRSGKDRKYPAFSTTSYGDPGGLFGVNCRHVKYPFIPGISEQRYTEYDEDENRRIYEQSQKQRYLERQIRHAKRELRMMEAMKDEVGAKEARSKIRDRQADMREFIEDTGRRRSRGREQIY